MTSLLGVSPTNQWLRRTGSLTAAGHIGYAASLALHLLLGTLALLIAVVTTLDDNLASNERLDVSDTKLGIAILLWLVALAVLGILWIRRSPWGWLAPLIWALVGIPLAVTHAEVEIIPPASACAAAGRISPGINSVNPEQLPSIAWCHESVSSVQAVATLGETVYLASMDGTLTALDQATGEIAWESGAGAASVAIVAQPEVVLGGDGSTVTAWTPAGQQLWTAATPGPVSALAMNGSDQVFVACADGTVLALDGKSGAERWRVTTAVTGAQLAITGQDLYAFNSPREITVILLEASSGEVRGAWMYDIGPSTYFTPPVLAGQTLVAGYEVRQDNAAQNTGGAIGMNPSTGTVLWNFPLITPVQVAPTIVGGVAHILELNGQLYRLDPQSGQVIRPPEIIESRARGEIDANRLLASDGNTVYISQRGGVVSAGNIFSGVITATDTTGAALWRFRLSSPPVFPATVSGNVVFIADDRSLFAILEPAAATPAATPVQ